MKRILVAEDDPDVSGLVKTLLEAAGHEVRIAEDGEKALEAFRRDGADVVILDVLLPGRNGFQVAESIRAGEEGADVPIVMLSGVYRGPMYRTQARRRFGAVEYLEKPVEVDQLLAAILKAMEGPKPRRAGDDEPDDEPTEMSALDVAALPLPPPRPTPGVDSAAFQSDSSAATADQAPADRESAAPTTDREPARVDTGATTTDRPPDDRESLPPASPSGPPPEVLASPTEPMPVVRSLAASARALSGSTALDAPDGDEPGPRVAKAPRPTPLAMPAFNPESVGRADNRLSALRSKSPEVTDERKARPPRHAVEVDEAPFSLANLPPSPAAAAPEHREQVDEEDIEEAVDAPEAGAGPYADPESLRERKLVERSIRVTRGAAQGNLRHTPFPVLLHRLYKERVSGALLLVKDPVKKIVYFKEGLPVFVKSNLLSECLGKVLVRERLISDAQCRESLRLLQETKRQQGSLLIQMGALSDTNLGYGLQLQLRTKLYEVFSWTHGEYRLSTRTKPPMETAMLESTEIEGILFEGIRTAFDPERLRRELEPCVELFLALSREAEPRLQAMPLQAADRLGRHLDQRRPHRAQSSRGRPRVLAAPHSSSMRCSARSSSRRARSPPQRLRRPTRVPAP